MVIGYQLQRAGTRPTDTNISQADLSVAKSGLRSATATAIAFAIIPKPKIKSKVIVSDNHGKVGKCPCTASTETSPATIPMNIPTESRKALSKNNIRERSCRRKPKARRVRQFASAFNNISKQHECQSQGPEEDP